MDWLASEYLDCVARHGVDPTLFLALYGSKSLVYWYTVFRILVAVRRRHWVKIPPLVLVNITTNILPWAYIYFFGHNLPWWLPWLMGWFVIYSTAFLAWEIYRRVKARGGLKVPLTQRVNP